MLTALLTQFPPGAVTTRFHTFVRTAERLAEVLELVRNEPGGVCHAVVSGEFKEQITAMCRSLKIPHFDMTGGAVGFLADVAGVAPRSDLASLHAVDAAYERRIEALEYTLSHDDGLGLSTLAEADVVLAGVSRTGKTPTSIYLAQQGYRVANVSLAVEVTPPPELLGLAGKKVVGLVIDPQQLTMIRARREADWQMERTSYGEPGHVVREMNWARQLFRRQAWPVLDVTDQAVEETAARIVHLLRLG
jgi:regulator of PEP synthase PpsR (kinase-PPPase family)